MPADAAPDHQARGLRVGLTFDLRESYLARGWSEEAAAEFDRPDTIDAIEDALRVLGADVDRIGDALQLVERLARGDRWDLVFNIAEGWAGVGRESLVPALLDAHEIPYTFSDPLVCAVTLDKPTCKRVMRDMGLPTPEFAVVSEPDEADAVRLATPLFVKPAREGSSKGVSPESLVTRRDDLRSVCGSIIERFSQPALVESFLPGREVTVGLTGSGADARVVGVMEVLTNDGRTPDVYAFASKEECERLLSYRLANDAFAADASAVALAAWRGLGCRDGGRVDVRADASGRPSVIEINPLPGMHPTHSDLPIMWSLGGRSYADLVGAIVESALQRLAVVSCAS